MVFLLIWLLLIFSFCHGTAQRLAQIDVWTYIFWNINNISISIYQNQSYSKVIIKDIEKQTKNSNEQAQYPGLWSMQCIKTIQKIYWVINLGRYSTLLRNFLLTQWRNIFSILVFLHIQKANMRPLLPTEKLPAVLFETKSRILSENNHLIKVWRYRPVKP